MPILDHPQAEQILRQVQEGKLSISEAAQRLGVEYHILWKHLKRREAKRTKVIVESLDEKIQMLGRILEKVEQVVNKLLVSAYTGEGLRYGPNWIRELRSLMKDMATYQQQIVESPTVLVQNVMNVQTEMQTFLLQNLCPKCKKKFIEYLESMK